MVFLVLLGNSWLFAGEKKPSKSCVFAGNEKNPSNSWFFAGNPRIPKKNQENLEKTKNPRIQDFHADVWPTTKSWILGFLEVFLVFLVLLGNSWVFAGNPKNT